jgi:uncharacterized protein YjbJ (UPF0337 family)
MKSSTKNRLAGKFHQMKGKFKKAAGKLSRNRQLEADGAGEVIAGVAQEKFGQVKKVWGN